MYRLGGDKVSTCEYEITVSGRTYIHCMALHYIHIHVSILVYVHIHTHICMYVWSPLCVSRGSQSTALYSDFRLRQTVQESYERIGLWGSGNSKHGMNEGRCVRSDRDHLAIPKAVDDMIRTTRSES